MTGASAILKGVALTAFSVLGLTACQTTPPPVPAPDIATNMDTVALQADTQAFAQNTAIAAFYSQRCDAEGIALADGSAQAASAVFFDRMIEAGYSRAQIETATAAVDTTATGQAAVAYLEERGLQPGV